MGRVYETRVQSGPSIELMSDEFRTLLSMTEKLLGYARVSTDLQNPDLQTDALTQAGCDRIWVDKVSGTILARPQLNDMLDYARTGDTIVVWRLDRLGRSVKDLVDLMGVFQERGLGFRSLTEGMDTTSPGGMLIYHVFAAVAQFEADLIRSRTMAGLNAARARGRVGGRPKNLTQEQTSLIDQWIEEGRTITSIAKTVGTTRTTVYRYLSSR